MKFAATRDAHHSPSMSFCRSFRSLSVFDWQCVEEIFAALTALGEYPGTVYHRHQVDRRDQQVK